MRVAERSRLCSVHQHRSGGELDESVRVLADPPQYDGSDSGARPDEAISWGKIRAGAESVKVSLDIWSRLRADCAGLRRCDIGLSAHRGSDLCKGPLGERRWETGQRGEEVASHSF